MKDRATFERDIKYLGEHAVSHASDTRGALLVAEILLDIRDQNERIIRHLNVMHPHDVG